MPPKPKPKETAVKKLATSVARPSISNSSLLFVPADAVEGHQERLERCVNWTLSGSAIRHHQQKCLRKDIPPLSFTEAFLNKVKKSFLHGFLDEESTLSLQEHYDITLALALWESENGCIEKKNCFKNDNNFTDDLLRLIKEAVRKNDRDILKNGLKDSLVLRVTNAKMTYLDEGLREYKRLTTLSLCGNYIDEIDCDMLPLGLRVLELQANKVSNLDSFKNLPHSLLYLGLSRNILTNENLHGISQFPRMLTVLDLSDNDIYHLDPLLDVLVRLPNLKSLLLYGNPCSVSAAYALTVITRLFRLRWLDNRRVLKTDHSERLHEPHADDLRSAYFNFTVLRIMSPPVPPKPEKGTSGYFHVELELPLLDASRRSYLMFGRYESLVELLPTPEDDFLSHTTSKDTMAVEIEMPSEETDIFEKLEPKNSRIIQHYTTFESNKVAWNKVLNFQEPTIRIFCPDLRALRDTFRSTITLKLIYTLHTTQKKPDKSADKSATKLKQHTVPTELRVTIATVKCSLRNPDWSQPSQHFHWDASFDTNNALHWGDGDLNAVNYQQTTAKPTKGKQESSKEKQDTKTEKLQIPEILTCQFGFGIDTLHS